MKGFGIYVKNNLLEPKHIENMDAAVWLYLWLLDKMTSVNENGIGKVLGGMPVTYSQIHSEMGLTERTYQRWIRKLRDTGYIRTLRTPYGLVITVNKAEKIFTKKSSAKSGGGRATNGGSNKTIQDNTVDSTNVEAPTRYGKPEINEMFDFWSQEVGFDIESKVTANRRAASNLIRKYGAEKLTQLIKGVALTQSDQYAPAIADFCDLQSKTTQLIAWGRKKHGTSSVEVIS